MFVHSQKPAHSLVMGLILHLPRAPVMYLQVGDNVRYYAVGSTMAHGKTAHLQVLRVARMSNAIILVKQGWSIKPTILVHPSNNARCPQGCPPQHLTSPHCQWRPLPRTESHRSGGSWHQEQDFIMKNSLHQPHKCYFRNQVCIQVPFFIFLIIFPTLPPIEKIK